MNYNRDLKASNNGFNSEYSPFFYMPFKLNLLSLLEVLAAFSTYEISIFLFPNLTIYLKKQKFLVVQDVGIKIYVPLKMVCVQLCNSEGKQ